MAAAAQQLGDNSGGGRITVVSPAGPSARVVASVPLQPGRLYGGGSSSSSSAVHPELSGTSQLDPIVAIDIPTSVQDSNSDGPQQLVLAIDAPNSTHVSSSSRPLDGNNNGNLKWMVFLALVLFVANWTTVTTRALLKKPAFLAFVLFAAECTTGTIALLKKPPGSSAAWYIVADALILAAGMLEGLAAVLISCNARKYCTFGTITHLISTGAVILGIALEVYDYKVKK